MDQIDDLMAGSKWVNDDHQQHIAASITTAWLGDYQGGGGGGVVREKNVQEEVRNKKKRQKSIDVDDVDGESGRRDVPFHRARCLVLLKYI